MSILLPTRRALNVGAWATNSLWKAAKSVPSLDLRFAENKSLVDSVSGQDLITFTRASSGTYVGSDGLIKTAAANEPRFDHNPTTGESLGLLVEEQRTNLLLRSEEFDNASWIKNDSSISANVIAAPNGSTTADKLVEDTNATQHYTSQAISGGNATYTHSVFAKQADAGRHLYIEVGNARASINLNTGSVFFGPNTFGTGWSNPQVNVTPFKDGWYRIAITATADNTVTSVNAKAHIATLTGGAGGIVYTGDGTSGIYLWGAQLEAGTFPTSYIPTTSATVTRSADVASITGANFSRWYSNSGSTLLAYGASDNPSSSNQCIAGVGVFTDGAQIRETPTQIIGMFRGTYGSDAISQVLPLGLRKMAIAYAPNTAGLLSLNGSVYVGENRSSALSLPSGLGIGASGEFNSFWNGTVSRLTYWPSKLSDFALQEITR